MPKDNVSSFGTEVLRSNEKLAEKKQESNSKLTVDEIFVLIPGSPSHFILGPCFKTTLPPELSPLYPVAEGEKLLLHCVQPDSFKGNTLRSWPNVNRTWINWVDRVEKAKWEVWKSADIIV